MVRPVALLAVLLLASFPGSVRAIALPDSTAAESWRLANGLEVRVRYVPGAVGVATTMAYRAGSAYEPAAREGLANLLAEIQFTAAAGDVPERTREEMDSLRVVIVDDV